MQGGVDRSEASSRTLSNLQRFTSKCSSGAPASNGEMAFHRVVRSLQSQSYAVDLLSDAPSPDHAFILFFGQSSSLFGSVTFFLMLHVFSCWNPARATLFQTDLFVESLLTSTLIIHIIRANRPSLFQSLAGVALTITAVGVMLIGVWFPYSSLASALGFTTLPEWYWPRLDTILACYIALTHSAKCGYSHVDRCEDVVRY
jgi:hypothetical protein